MKPTRQFIIIMTNSLGTQSMERGQLQVELKHNIQGYCTCLEPLDRKKHFLLCSVINAAQCLNYKISETTWFFIHASNLSTAIKRVLNPYVNSPSIYSLCYVYTVIQRVIICFSLQIPRQYQQFPSNFRDWNIWESIFFLTKYYKEFSTEKLTYIL